MSAASEGLQRRAQKFPETSGGARIARPLSPEGLDKGGSRVFFRQLLSFVESKVAGGLKECRKAWVVRTGNGRASPTEQYGAAEHEGWT